MDWRIRARQSLTIATKTLYNKVSCWEPTIHIANNYMKQYIRYISDLIICVCVQVLEELVDLVQDAAEAQSLRMKASIVICQVSVAACSSVL